MSNNIPYSPISYSINTSNLHLELPSISNLTSPLISSPLISSPLITSNIFGFSNSPITTFTFSEPYSDDEQSILEQGLLPKYKRSFKVPQKTFTFSFSDKGKKVKKLII